MVNEINWSPNSSVEFIWTEAAVYNDCIDDGRVPDSYTPALNVEQNF